MADGSTIRIAHLAVAERSEANFRKDVEERRLGDLLSMTESLQFATGGSNESHGVGIGRRSQKAEEFLAKPRITCDRFEFVEETDEVQIRSGQFLQCLLKACEVARFRDFRPLANGGSQLAAEDAAESLQIDVALPLEIDEEEDVAIRLIEIAPVDLRLGEVPKE